MTLPPPGSPPEKHAMMQEVPGKAADLVDARKENSGSGWMPVVVSGDDLPSSAPSGTESGDWDVAITRDAAAQ
jgi:hypothetical protein